MMERICTCNSDQGINENEKEQLIRYLMHKAIEQATRLRVRIKHLSAHLVDELMQEVHLRLFEILKRQGFRTFPPGTCLCTINPLLVNQVLWCWQLKCAKNLYRYYVRGLATRRKHRDLVAWHSTNLRKRFSPDGRQREASSAFHLSRFAIARKIKAALSGAEWLQLKQCLKDRKNLEQLKPSLDSKRRYRLIRKILTILKSDERDR